MKAWAFLLAATALLAGPGEAQRAGDAAPQFLGGYHARACAYPKAAREAALSGCCAMTLEIDAQGHVTKASGTCTDPVFFEPTRRCLSTQAFSPARRGGKPVKATHEMEYEWRANAPSPGNMCKRLGVS
jgi:hypothetical protein